MAIAELDLNNLDEALPNGFSLRETDDDPEVYAGMTEDHLIQISLIGGRLGDGQADARPTSAEAVRFAMALIALAESNR